MIELEKRISGDWIEIRQKSNDLYGLLESFAIPPTDLKLAADRLRLSVEQGIVEFKRLMMSPVLVALETARYTSLPADDMAEHERSLSVLLLAILVQRLLSSQLLPLSRPQEEKRDFGIGSLPVNAIVSDLNARVKADAELRAHPAVKNILMQVHRYNAENQKMRQLLPGIKAEMRSAFLANFTRTFEEILGSIRRNYLVILEEDARAEKARTEGFSLSLMPLKEIAPLLASQAKEVSRFRSTLAHAREEKYKTREALVRLYDGRQAVLKLIEEEPKSYRRICQRTRQQDIDSCSLLMATGFRDEVALILERQGRREGTP
jgi:hypothetical protein